MLELPLLAEQMNHKLGCHVTGFSYVSQDSNGTGLEETCVSHQRGLIPGCQEGSERLPREILPQRSHQIPR